MRSATLTLGAPPATAVAMGPLSATLLRRTDSRAPLIQQGAGSVTLSMGAAGCISAGFDLLPINIDASRFQDALHGGRNLGADAFTGDQRDFMSHSCIVL